VLHPTNNPANASTLNVVSSSLTTSATAIWAHQVCVTWYRNRLRLRGQCLICRQSCHATKKPPAFPEGAFLPTGLRTGTDRHRRRALEHRDRPWNPSAPSELSLSGYQVNLRRDPRVVIPLLRTGSMRMASSIDLFRRKTVFDPEAVTVLAAALDEAWDLLRKSESECVRPAYARVMREVVARRIFDLGQSGISDKKQLADGAMRFLNENYRHESKGPCWETIAVRSRRLRFLRSDHVAQPLMSVAKMPASVE
jgi:hypothetical protein